MNPPSFLTSNGIALSLALGLGGLACAYVLIRKILASSAGNEKMAFIAKAVQDGAQAYLTRQMTAVGMIALPLAICVYFIRGGGATGTAATIGFAIGAGCSMLAGYIGMYVAVRANVRTAQAASVSSHAALKVAFNGGAVTGLLVVALGLISVAGFYAVMLKVTGGDTKAAIESLIGLALGSSLISVFARLGGGIYTKAADVGADLVGKIEQNLPEDDPRNPATIADNVGDNVGDCAGMAADVFETYAVSLIGGVLVAFLTVKDNSAALIYPFILCGLALVASLVGIGFVNFVKQKSATNSLIGGVAISGLISALLFYLVTGTMFGDTVTIAGRPLPIPSINIFLCAVVGLVLTVLVVWFTNYYTSTFHAPVRRIAKASETGHATNIIAGISVGHHSTVLPVLAIAASIWATYHWADLYGIAIAVVSMLSLSGIIISLDAFGPITDNAGGIAAMSGLPESVRKITDELDAVGNTMKAVTKGYAIASAGLAAMVLFGSYVQDLKSMLPDLKSIPFDLSDPMVIIGMFVGGLLPYLFTAFSMDAVGSAAGAVVIEVRRQIKEKPGILTGADIPDYRQCVDIVTKAALSKMTVPALLPLLFVVGIAFLGKEALGGLLIGTIVTGLFVGIAMTSAGGAWDNAKKYVEEGNHGGKGSFAHAAAVTGDTVGDPYKDTSGPAVNPMIKVVNILAIVIIPIMVKYGFFH